MILRLDEAERCLPGALVQVKASTLPRIDEGPVNVDYGLKDFMVALGVGVNGVDHVGGGAGHVFARVEELDVEVVVG